MRAALALAGLLITGCASLPSPMSTPAPSPLPDADGCVRWLQALDAEVAHAGVRDAGQVPVPGFPMLRADRLAAASKPAIGASVAAFDAWVEHLRSLDIVEADGRVLVEDQRSVKEPRLWLAGYGDWTGPGSATLMGAARTARDLVQALVSPTHT